MNEDDETVGARTADTLADTPADPGAPDNVAEAVGRGNGLAGMNAPRTWGAGCGKKTAAPVTRNRLGR